MRDVLSFPTCHSKSESLLSWVVVVHPYNPSTQEAEAGESLWARDQPSLQNKFQDSQSFYTKKPCLEKWGKKRKKEFLTNFNCFILKWKGKCMHSFLSLTYLSHPFLGCFPAFWLKVHSLQYVGFHGELLLGVKHPGCSLTLSKPISAGFACCCSSDRF